MEAYFYERDVVEKNLQGEDVTTPKVLFFHLTKASIADARAEPFVFDGAATAQHKKDYFVQLASFEASKNSSEVTEPVLIENEPVVTGEGVELSDHDVEVLKGDEE